MVSAAMTITASRATTNPATSPVGSSGGLPAGPGVVSSVVEGLLGVFCKGVDEGVGVDEGAGIDEGAGVDEGAGMEGVVTAEEGLKDAGTLVVTAVETLVVEGALIVLVTSLLGRAMVVVMGSTMVVVMAMVDVGVGQNIVEVNVEGQLSFSVVAVTTKGTQCKSNL